jgi:hypothetical protein
MAGRLVGGEGRGFVVVIVGKQLGRFIFLILSASGTGHQEPI